MSESGAAGHGDAVAGPVRLLRETGPLRALFTARVVSYGGESLMLVALMLYVADTTGQGLAVAVLLLVGDFVPSLISPVTGAISDRFDLRRVMIVCEVAQGALVLLIALSLPPLPLLLALVGARAIASQIFLPASRSAIPAMVASRNLGTANSAVGFGTNCAEAFGPLLAAALLPFVHVRGVLLVAAASYLFSALVLTTVRAMPPVPDPDRDSASLLTQARSGLGYILSTPAIRGISLGFCAVVAFNGIDDVALVLLVKENLRSGDSSVGLLLSAVGIGLVVGYALLSRYGGRASMTAMLIGGFVVSSAGNLLTGFAWAVAAAFTVQAVRGIGIAAMDVASSTLLQRLVPAGMLGRVFGNLYGAIGVAAAASYVGGGLLLDAIGAPYTLMVAGTGGLAFTLLVAVTLPRAVRAHAQLPSKPAQEPPQAEDEDRPGLNIDPD